MAMKAFIPLFLLLSVLGPGAFAFEMNVLGGMNYAAPSEFILGVDQGWTGSSAGTFGINASLPLFSGLLSIETGAFWVATASERTESGVPLLRKAEWIQAPLLLHYHFDGSMSLGAGGYAAFSRGMVATTTLGSTLNQPYDTAQIQREDFGLIFDLRARFHLTPGLHLILDARYQHGLRDLSTLTTKSLSTRSIQVLAGMGYEFD